MALKILPTLEEIRTQFNKATGKTGAAAITAPVTSEKAIEQGISDAALANRRKSAKRKALNKVSQAAIYVSVPFVYTSGSNAGRTVYMRMRHSNAKFLGMLPEGIKVVSGKIKKEVLVVTKPVQFGLGRELRTRKTPTKGGSSIRGGGRTKGGSDRAYVKTFVTVPVPKNATLLDIAAYANSVKLRSIYEVRYNGSSFLLKPYPEPIAGKGGGEKSLARAAAGRAATTARTQK